MSYAYRATFGGAHSWHKLSCQARSIRQSFCNEEKRNTTTATLLQRATSPYNAYASYHQLDSLGTSRPPAVSCSVNAVIRMNEHQLSSHRGIVRPGLSHVSPLIMQQCTTVVVLMAPLSHRNILQMLTVVMREPVSVPLNTVLRCSSSMGMI